MKLRNDYFRNPLQMLESYQVDIRKEEEKKLYEERRRFVNDLLNFENYCFKSLKVSMIPFKFLIIRSNQETVIDDSSWGYHYEDLPPSEVILEDTTTEAETIIKNNPNLEYLDFSFSIKNGAHERCKALYKKHVLNVYLIAKKLLKNLKVLIIEGFVEQKYLFDEEYVTEIKKEAEPIIKVDLKIIFTAE